MGKVDLDGMVEKPYQHRSSGCLVDSQGDDRAIEMTCSHVRFFRRSSVNVPSMTTGILVTIPCLHLIGVLDACTRTRAPASMGVRTSSDVCTSSLVSFQSRAYALGEQSVSDSEFNPSSALFAPLLRTGLKGVSLVCR